MAKEKDDQQELELVAVEDGEQQQQQDGEADATPPAQADGEERLAQEADADDGDEGEDSGASEAIRAQRRAERKAKKERERAARDRNRKELDFLRRRNEELERWKSDVDARLTQNELSGVGDRLSQVEQQIRVAKDVMAQALTKGEGANHVEASEIHDDLVRTREKLLARKGELERPAETRREAPQPQAPDPELLRHADEWRRKNSWYQYGGTDNDSTVVSALDQKLAAEGYDPRTEEYWDELTARTKQYLPHRFKANGNGNGQRREGGGPVMANGGRERALKAGEVYVSADRRKAMEEAGVWDDPKLRQRYLKSYASYDEAAQRNRA